MIWSWEDHAHGLSLNNGGLGFSYSFHLLTALGPFPALFTFLLFPTELVHQTPKPETTKYFMYWTT